LDNLCSYPLPRKPGRRLVTPNAMGRHLWSALATINVPRQRLQIQTPVTDKAQLEGGAADVFGTAALRRLRRRSMRMLKAGGRTYSNSSRLPPDILRANASRPHSLSIHRKAVRPHKIPRKKFQSKVTGVVATSLHAEILTEFPHCQLSYTWHGAITPVVKKGAKNYPLSICLAAFVWVVSVNLDPNLADLEIWIRGMGFRRGTNAA
jgi:hypothetical protein